VVSFGSIMQAKESHWLADYRDRGNRYLPEVERRELRYEQ
jgi:hypothetical protein